MKKVIEKTQPAYVLYESPEKCMGVYNESIVVKMEYEVTMYVCGDWGQALGLHGLFTFTPNI